MKHRILDIVYTVFDEWAEQTNWACRKGCATCCTQNVTITAIEGEQILSYIQKHDKQQWLVTILEANQTETRPHQTLNSFARACMAGLEPEPEDEHNFQPCPFLLDDCCTVYAVRPFACRCFLSMHSCSKEEPALISPQYLAASTAINQLIEHLGQREYWGNMLDVLTAQLDSSRYRDIYELLDDPTKVIQARSCTLEAEPLPGFMLDANEQEYVTPLLEKIFSHTIDNKTVEDILNGK